MGSTTSCCVSASPKLRRNAHSRLESYHQESELSREETGCNLQHISDRENVDEKYGATDNILFMRADSFVLLFVFTLCMKETATMERSPLH
eukprot:superscaffoldBa00001281_g9909